MIKKITFFLVFLVSIFTLCSFTTKIVEVGVINDNTTIYNDLTMLGLTPSDYITLEATQENDCYDEEYLIAVGENRKEDNSTDVYLYLYNPVMFKLDYAYMFELNINNSLLKLLYVSDESYFSNFKDSYDIEIGLCEYSSSYNIAKLKFNYINHVNERKYDLDQITRYYHISADYNTYYLEQTFNNPFTATFKEREEDGQLVSDFEYNSFIYITKDVLVPVRLSPEFKWSEFFQSILDKDSDSMAFFYNFSSSKKIEQILELDVVFDTEFRRTSIACKDDLLGYNDGYVEPKNGVERTLYNEKQSYDWLSTHLEFETFQTPAENRFTNEEFGYLEFNEEQIKQFTDYEHSVLIGMNTITLHSIPVMGGGALPCYHYEEINNLQVKRIKFETDGKIYNSYVADDPDNPIDPIIPETPKTWFDELLDWVKDNPLYAILIVIGLVVLLPLIIALLPTIISFLIKIIIGIVKLPFKLISSIIDKIKKKKKTKEDKYI